MCKWRWDAGVQLQFTQGLDCKNAKCQGSKHKTPKTAPFSCYCSSSSRLKRTPTTAHTITPAVNTIYGLKKRLCSLAIKARDSPCTQWEQGGKLRGRTGGKLRGRKRQSQGWTGRKTGKKKKPRRAGGTEKLEKQREGDWERKTKLREERNEKPEEKSRIGGEDRRKPAEQRLYRVWTHRIKPENKEKKEKRTASRHAFVIVFVPASR